MLRQVFPCGLVQPAGAFRASADALLLADFALVGAGERFVDLGTGCGIVACGIALACSECSGVGVERETELVGAARENIRRLDLGARLSCVEGDVGDGDLLTSVGRGAFDVVVANPPYRIAGRGRPAAQALRERALAGDADCLGRFFGAGAALLRHHGRFVCVLSAERLGDALVTLRDCGLGLRRLCCVYGKKGGQAKRVLLEARKNAKEDIRIEAPLYLPLPAKVGTQAECLVK